MPGCHILKARYYCNMPPKYAWRTQRGVKCISLLYDGTAHFHELEVQWYRSITTELLSYQSPAEPLNPADGLAARASRSLELTLAC